MNKWKARLMGSEGWAVWDDGRRPGRMLASNLSEKDAKLMAAAPELFEGCQDAVQQYELTSLMVGADLADAINIFCRNGLEKVRLG